MRPASFWEKVYEPIIRRAAGLGALTREEDPDEYDKGFLHCDLLVIGAGSAGLSAALTAGRAGARVILSDEDFRMGGRLNAETHEVGGMAGADWAAAAVAELATMPNVRLMPRTTIVGAFDHGIYSALERVSDHLAVPEKGKPRQTLWRIYSRREILAGGATERLIAFENNNRPGIMLACNLRAKAVDVVAVIDARTDGPLLPGIRHVKVGEVVDAQGRLGLSSIYADTEFMPTLVFRSLSMVGIAAKGLA